MTGRTITRATKQLQYLQFSVQAFMGVRRRQPEQTFELLESESMVIPLVSRHMLGTQHDRRTRSQARVSTLRHKRTR